MLLEGLQLVRRKPSQTLDIPSFLVVTGAFLTCCLLVSVVLHTWG
jgi:hypothetical protein